MIGLSTGGALVAGEAGLRLYYWSKGIGRGDVRELLLRSQNVQLQEIEGGGGLFGLLKPSEIPKAVYEIKPHLRGRFLGASLATNRWGFRGPEVTRQKPEGTSRVVGIGDSFMFGWAMPQDSYYLALLEGELNALASPGARFEVLNFGTPGYNTVMEAALFEHKAVLFEPDVLVLHFVGNDLASPHFLDPPRSLRLSRWVLVETIRGLFGEVEEELDSTPLPPDQRGETRRAAFDVYDHLGGGQEFRRALFRIQKQASERQIPMLFMTLGEDSELRRFARATALEAGFHVLNPVEYFKQLLVETGREVTPRNFRRAFRRGDRHPTPLGHQAYARALRCELAYLGLAGLATQATSSCLSRQAVAPSGAAGS